jgi:hypothetical protein
VAAHSALRGLLVYSDAYALVIRARLIVAGHLRSFNVMGLVLHRRIFLSQYKNHS